MAKHSEKTDYLLGEIKKLRTQLEYQAALSFKSYMLMACHTLYDDFEYDQENIEAFVSGIYKHLEEYENGTMTIGDMERELYDEIGVVVEGPDYGNKSHDI